MPSEWRGVFIGLLALIAGLLRGQTTLEGTAALTYTGDPAATMVDDINRFLSSETAALSTRRATLWKRDYASAAAYDSSITHNRERLRTLIGAVDMRVSPPAIQIQSSPDVAVEVAVSREYKVYAVRWPVFEGVDGEGLLFQPVGTPRARVVALPDADWSPEMLAGLAPGVEPVAQIARRLAESGCQVLVPTLIDRKDTWSGIPGIRMTNQPHREWIYRMAYQVGRHIIGYEVQQVLAAVDWFQNQNKKQLLPIGVAGYGEGGLLALYAASLDTRIGATLTGGYFAPRDQVWSEPIYRDLWGLLREFGDAEIAAMIAPRTLIVDASHYPMVAAPPPSTPERKGAAPVGSLIQPPLDAVRNEVERARPVFAALHVSGHLQLVSNGDAFPAFLKSMGLQSTLRATPPSLRWQVDAQARLHRQFDALVAHTQRLVQRSPERRKEFWSGADSASIERWTKSTQPLRAHVWDEVIGRMPVPQLAPNARTRLISETPKFRSYEVMLDFWPGIFAYGVLLVPKGIKPDERRPVVVCQHGLEGRPKDVADPTIDSPYYHRYAVRLAEEGFVTFAPQNPYIGEDRFRQIQRRGHPLKLSLFSFVLGQHQRILEWLGSLQFVDAKRIGFYGLSYGGKTAVRVPPLLDGYALSICSADFNEWVWKTTSVSSKYSYMLTNEYDMLEFNFANVVNYGELASLMAPRPFMVERGHDDGVAPDEWVAYEYAKVRRFYAKLGLQDRTEIEFFNGPHTIHGEGTFAFLRRHLHWPN